MSSFGDYSRYYDLLYRDKNYQAEAEYVGALLREGGKSAGDVLELGCGTGMHALLLARQGFGVHGIDLSQTMLEQAQARRANQDEDVRRRLSFSAGDVRTFRTDRRFDAAISLFHVFSYQTTNNDLAAAFCTAAAHLRPSGLLVCDFWYGPAVLRQRPEVRVKRMHADDVNVVRIAEPVLHHERNVVDVNFEISITDRRTRLTSTLHETHPMRYLFVPELEALSGAASLALRRTFSWLSATPLDADSWSGCAVFQKV